jgi:hypothetical protein
VRMAPTEEAYKLRCDAVFYYRSAGFRRSVFRSGYEP